MSGGDGTEAGASSGSGDFASDEASFESGNSEYSGAESGSTDRAEGFDDLNVPEGAGRSSAGETSVEGVDAEEIARLRLEARENYDKYLRSVADLENYKKRAIKERSDLIKYAGENLARDVVEVLDDIERAVTAESKGSLEDFLKGVSMIRDRFLSVLEQHSIKAQSGLGKDFDPVVQQALASVPTADHSPGTVIQEFKKAYYFKDKLLRHGQVVVSAAPPEGDSKE